MVPVLAALGAALVAATVGVVALWVRFGYARRLPAFRCRVGPAGQWRGSRSRWWRRRTWAAWAGAVLLVRSGVLRLWITPLVVGVDADVTVQPLEPAQVRGLGPRPVALRFTTQDGRQLEVAAANWDVGRLVGPFLTAALSGLPPAPREHGA